MIKSIKRLKEYVDNDSIYQESKKGYEPSHNDGSGDFERFCIEHCSDIEKLLDAYMEQVKRNGALQYALCAVREKWNNDKARYRRKAKRYRHILKSFEEWLKDRRENKKFLTTFFFTFENKPKSFAEIEEKELDAVIQELNELKENN